MSVATLAGSSAAAPWPATVRSVSCGSVGPRVTRELRKRRTQVTRLLRIRRTQANRAIKQNGRRAKTELRRQRREVQKVQKDVQKAVRPQVTRVQQSLQDQTKQARERVQQLVRCCAGRTRRPADRFLSDMARVGLPVRPPGRAATSPPELSAPKGPTLFSPLQTFVGRRPRLAHATSMGFALRPCSTRFSRAYALPSASYCGGSPRTGGGAAARRAGS